MERTIDQFERQLLRTEPIHSIEYRGNLDVTTLNKAFDILLDRHPIIRAEIRHKNGRTYVSTLDQERPQITIYNENCDVNDDLEKMPLDDSTKLADFFLVQNNSRGRLIARINHMACDGRHGVEIMRDLWRIYTKIADDRSAPLEIAPELPGRPLDLFAERWPEELPINTSGHADSPVENMMNGFVFFPSGRVRLRVDETLRFKNAAKRNGITFHALLTGVLISSVPLYARQVASNDPKILYACAVDLRDRVDPPVGITEATNFSHLCGLYIPSCLSISAADLGARINEQVNSRIDRKTFFRPDKDENPGGNGAAQMEEIVAGITVTNIGYVRPFDSPPELELDNYRIRIVSRRLLEGSLPQRPFGVMLCVALTYNDRLNVEFYCPDASTKNASMSQFTDEVQRKIRQY